MPRLGPLRGTSASCTVTATDGVRRVSGNRRRPGRDQSLQPCTASRWSIWRVGDRVVVEGLPGGYGVSTLHRTGRGLHPVPPSPCKQCRERRQLGKDCTRHGSRPVRGTFPAIVARGALPAPISLRNWPPRRPSWPMCVLTGAHSGMRRPTPPAACAVPSRGSTAQTASPGATRSSPAPGTAPSRGRPAG